MGLFDCFNKKKQAAGSLVSQAQGWTIGPTINGTNYSTGMPGAMSKDNAGYYFDFPKKPGGVDYAFKPFNSFKNKLLIDLKFSLEGSGTIVPCSNSGAGPARLRLFFQRRGDNWSGSDQYEFYRWWSIANVVLQSPGDFSLSAQFDPKLWSSVLGKTGDRAENAFKAALSEVGVAGFTFGASFAGHGDYAEGKVRFRLKSFDVM